MNFKSMNNNCRSLAIVVVFLNALQTAVGCRGGEVLSELQKRTKKSFRAVNISGKSLSACVDKMVGNCMNDGSEAMKIDTWISSWTFWTCEKNINLFFILIECQFQNLKDSFQLSLIKLFFKNKWEKNYIELRHDRGRTRTCNLRVRSPTHYPLCHAAILYPSWVVAKLHSRTFPDFHELFRAFCWFKK